MANWNNPNLASLYPAFLQELKDRDSDSIIMFPGSNIPVGAKRWNPPTNTFQSWDGAVWNNLVIATAGGGTGSIVPLPPLGTMASQNSNAVAITGGTIAGVALDAGAITTGILALNRGGTGASLALGPAGSFLQSIAGAVAFGVNGAALTGLNASALAVGNVPIARMPVGAQQWNIAPWIQLIGGGFIVGPIADMGPGSINAQSIFINGVAIGGSSIPAGMMAMFNGGCPAGWTQVAAADGRVLRMMPFGTGGTGGSDTHSHNGSIVGNSDNAAPLTTSNAAYNGTNRSYDAGGSFSGFQPDSNATHFHQVQSHSHGVNIPYTTDPASSFPSFIEFTLCSKN